jgi:hypothetical protein
MSLNAERRQPSAATRIASKASLPSTTEEKHAEKAEHAESR